jgi:hypothetical protein
MTIRAADDIAVSDEELRPSASEVLQAEIAETRQRVADGIDAISDRISPAAIEKRVKDSLKLQARTFLGLVRAHPVPFAFAGFGVSVLLWRLLRPARD